MLDFAFLFCRLKLDDYLFCGFFFVFGLLSSSAVIFYLYAFLKEYIYSVLDFAFLSCRLKLYQGLLIF